MEVSCRPASLYSGRGERRAWVLPLVAKNPRSSRRPGVLPGAALPPGSDEAFNQSPAGYGSRLRGPGAPSPAQPRPRPEEALRPASLPAPPQLSTPRTPSPDRLLGGALCPPGSPPPRAPQKTPDPSRPAPPRGKLCCGALPPLPCVYLLVGCGELPGDHGPDRS